MIGDTEILVIGGVIFLLFCADSLHKLAKAAGKMKKKSVKLRMKLRGRRICQQVKP
ncbi:MAG TPA: hypothetical protein ENI78_00285 [Euryarchaeota archaeon]|nr:hypothetical protein [Euryarchaeota archaeon]